MPADEDPAATLAMLVCSADSARANRRPRSPERRSRAPPAPPAPSSLAPPAAPAWLPGGTTYAEIVKGHGSRSASPNERPMQRLLCERDIRERSPSGDARPDARDQSEIISAVQPHSPTDYPVEPSEPKGFSEIVCEVSESLSSFSDPFVGDANVYYETETSEIHDYYSEQPLKHEESENIPILQVSPQTETSPTRSVKENRSHELSYAEILALGLRKQVKTQSITSLPKPQVAQVEMVKEIVVEVEKSPPVSYEPKTKNSLKIKTERPQRPSQRSRSREIPRQRRAPEKRPTKAHDIQMAKKKKLTRKVIEVQDFDDNIESVEIEQPCLQILPQKLTEEIVYKKAEEQSEKVDEENEKETDKNNKEKTMIEENMFEAEQKKPKKKHKSKKPKNTEDEIEKALKEIEESDKHKKKKVKDSRDKSKDGSESCDISHMTVESNVELKDTEPVTSKKKKTKKSTIETENLNTLTKIEVPSINEVKDANLQEQDLNKDEKLKMEKSNSIRIEKDESSENIIAENLRIEPSASESISQEHFSIEKENIQNVETGVMKQKKKKKGKKSDSASEQNITEYNDSVEIKNIQQHAKESIGVKEKNCEDNKTWGEYFAKSVDIEKLTRDNAIVSDHLSETKRKTKSKKPNNKDKQTPENYKGEVKEPEMLTLEEQSSTDNRPHKKKSKSKKVKSNVDDEIDRALKEIEQIDKSKYTKDKISKSKESKHESNIVQQQIETTTDSSVSSDNITVKLQTDLEPVSKDIPDTVKSSIITMDWNTLMAEDDKFSEPAFEPVTIPEQESDIEETCTEFIASEVTILQEAPNVLKNTNKESQQKSLEVEVSPDILEEINESIPTEVKEPVAVHIDTTTTSTSEQNNNDKFFSTDTRKGSPVSIVEEITYYKPIEQEETRKIYLITHEEKKLPPIRTVKVFNSKSNSLEEPSLEQNVGEKTIDETKAQENEALELKSSEIAEEIIESISKSKEDESCVALSEKLIEKEISFSESIESTKDNCNDKMGENILGSGPQSQYDVDTVSESIKYTDAVLNKNEQINDLNLALHADDSENILSVPMQGADEEQEDILEQVIFGSVQERKKPVDNIRFSPYLELNAEVKPYAVDLDYQLLDLNYYQLLLKEKANCSKPEETQSLNLTINDTKQRNDIHPEEYKIEIIQKQPSALFKENEDNGENKLSDCTHIASIQNSIPNFNYQELQDSEQKYAMLLTTSSPTNFDDDKSISVGILPENNVQSSEQIENTKLVNMLILEQPRYVYYDIADGEIKLAIIKSKEILKKDSIEKPDIFVVGKQEDSHTTESVEEIVPAMFKDNVILSNTCEDKNNVNSLRTESILELPSQNYQSIADAERIFALSKESHQKIVQEAEIEVPTQEVLKPVIHETLKYNYQEITDAEKTFGIILSREQSPETLTLTESDNVVEKVIIDEKQLTYEQPLIQNPQQLTNINTKLEEITTEPCQVTRDLNIIEQRVSEVQIQPSLSFETPRHSYQDLADAERLLACNKTKGMSITPATNAVEKDFKRIIDPTAEPLTTMNPNELLQSCSTSTITNAIVDTAVLVYHEVRDAEKLLATRLSQDASDVISEIKTPQFNENTCDIKQHISVEDGNTKLDSETKSICDKFEDVQKPESGPKEESSSLQSVLNNKKDSKVDANDHLLKIVEEKKVLLPPKTETACSKDTILEQREKIVPEKTVIDYTIDFISKESKNEEFKDTIDYEIINENEKLHQTSIDEAVENQMKLEKIGNTSNIKIEDITESLVPIVFGSDPSDKDILQMKETIIPEDNIHTLTSIDTELVVKDSDDDEFVVVDIIGDNQDSFGSDKDTNYGKEKIVETSSSELVEDAIKLIDETIEDVTSGTNTLDNIMQKNVSFGSAIDFTDESKTIPDQIENLESNVDIEADYEIIPEVCSLQREEELLQFSPSKTKPSDKPDSISATFIESEKTSTLSISETSNIRPVDTPSPPNDIKSTDSNLSHDIKRISDEFTKPNTNVTDAVRTEKSPIHSLHDLLPEIDSIPEFKPSFSNTVLYSNLSADAPEFTPSYMYQSVEAPVSKINSPSTLGDTKDSKRTEEDSNTEKTALPLDSENVSGPSNTTYSTVVPSSLKEQKESHLIEKEVLQSSAKDVDQVSLEEHREIEIKSKRSKKKKKEQDKKVVSKIPSNNAEKDQLPKLVEVTPVLEPVNVWAKAAEDGKSYAEVVAEGLVVEHTEMEIDHPSVEKPIEFLKETSESRINELCPDTPKDTEENVSSWAKIVASNRPSPERIQKSETIHTEVTQMQSYKAPVILVDESDNDVHRSDVQIDADGFIKVDRNRRSRSRSRERRSTSVSKTHQQSLFVRDKSENRFDALTSTLKPEDECVQSSLSDDEKQVVVKSRKSRSSKSKEKEVKLPSHTILSTSDEERQPLKKDKKKRSSKSKEKTITNVKKAVEPKLEDPKEKENVEKSLSLPESAEKQKKSKKKKKDKKPETKAETAESTGTASIVEISSSEQDNTDHIDEPQSSIKTAISTPESLQTPIKDRLYSEAQFWKFTPSELGELSSLSESLIVEVKDGKYEKAKFVESEDPPDSKSFEDNTRNVDKSVNLTENVIEENVSETETQTCVLDEKFSDEQSLESKIADIQREIEEMLLPENDNSAMSDEIPIELTETNELNEDLHDEMLDNMSPSLASPEPDEFSIQSKSLKNDDGSDLQIVEHIDVSMIDSVLDDSETVKTTSEKIRDNNTQQNEFVESSLKIEEKEGILPPVPQNAKTGTHEIETLDTITKTTPETLPTNIVSNIITNNLTNLKSDEFWYDKFAIDDAEKLLIIQNTKQKSELENVVSASQYVNLESNLKNDNSFWPEKHIYHDAECQYFISIANKNKTSMTVPTETLVKDQNDKDRDPDGGSGHSSESEEKESRQSSLPYDSNYISMDLPGGICSWKDHSSYLSVETPTDSLLGTINEDTSQVDIDTSEDTLTAPSLEPVTLPAPTQEEPAEQRIRKAAKVTELQSYCKTLHFLIYVWHDILTKFLISLITKICIVYCRLPNLPVVL
ncbi:titin-like [Melitaea cinxia]|uniref:titin-like n=1 Tax=Melitaea cinxia TaxID=113334 RepID=UPI001E2745F1|nr:titin-like [Melitaea cinxia]